MQLNAFTQPSWLDVFHVPMWHRCYQQLGSYGEVGSMTSKTSGACLRWSQQSVMLYYRCQAWWGVRLGHKLFNRHVEIIFKPSVTANTKIEFIAVVIHCSVFAVMV